MSKRRVKIRVEHRQKTFYERLLYVWRQETEDKNQKFTLYKAYVNLKNYPLEVLTIADLKHIHGIGETLAVRCYAAWEAASSSFSNLDLKTIKNLSNEDFIRYIEVAKKSGPIEVQPSVMKTKTVEVKKRSGRIYSTKDKETMPQHNAPLTSVASDQIGDMVINQCSYEESSEQIPLESTVEENIHEGTHFSVCQPSEKAEVILIADSREHNVTSSRDTVVECLTTSNHRVEMRPLSVGDYLWVLRKIDGTELILEWIVERKTWTDLHHSIRSGRYEEQKQRLRNSPMKNRVYLVEGTSTMELSASKQALATTLVSDGFLIQRTRNPQDTANFLCRLTEYLKSMTARRQITGMTFDHFQELSKKTHADTVKDMWIRQLMVCPGMSSNRAQIVAQRFPSFLSMLRLYSQDGVSEADTILSSAIPEVNCVLSAQMSTFFTSLLPQ
ncbi:hypothetical protein KIN20_037091 [Parelaphostrongylus tenuis]|uniref:Crossover junction endonuclease MUS81 n=1 Tax=Parelaphostrongylus tenuis TaxID=148309 RepID=A0AAD5WL19_PARTN|nr:hypothetical protein KIN20_037091 [Parelaphostrongylus tenuis]